jgi:hypothetical protein
MGFIQTINYDLAQSQNEIYMISYNEDYKNYYKPAHRNF